MQLLHIAHEPCPVSELHSLWKSDKIIAQTLSPSQKYSLQPGWINWRGLTAQQRVSLASAHLNTLKTWTHWLVLNFKLMFQTLHIVGIMGNLICSISKLKLSDWSKMFQLRKLWIYFYIKMWLFSAKLGWTGIDCSKWGLIAENRGWSRKIGIDFSKKGLTAQNRGWLPM